MTTIMAPVWRLLRRDGMVSKTTSGRCPRGRPRTPGFLNEMGASAIRTRRRNVASCVDRRRHAISTLVILEMTLGFPESSLKRLPHRP